MKNIDILINSGLICRKLRAGRLIACKSGKVGACAHDHFCLAKDSDGLQDRTAMVVTLEQCLMLINYHDMAPSELQRVLELQL
jgi:hypothetical protein